jgi:hypothetical protein
VDGDVADQGRRCAVHVDAVVARADGDIAVRESVQDGTGAFLVDHDVVDLGIAHDIRADDGVDGKPGERIDADPQSVCAMTFFSTTLCEPPSSEIPKPQPSGHPSDFVMWLRLTTLLSPDSTMPSPLLRV